MNAEEEKEHWKRLVNELLAVLSVGEVAQAAGVEPRQVWRWKSGEDRPKGMKAVHLHILHGKQCPARHVLQDIT